MGLFKNNPQGGIMDAIRCDEKNYLIWKWRPSGAALGESSRENAIRWGSPIRVKEGSVAVFVYSGKDGFVQDYIEGPADTIVDTKNLPIIASIIGLAYNGSTPFQAEVYFINLAETVQTKFAVPYFDVFDPELKEFGVPVAVRGSIDFNITDYREFVKRHRLDDFSIADLQAQIKDSVIENVKSIVSNAPEKYEIPVIQIERKISDVKAEVIALLREKFFVDYGVYLKDINIAGLEIDKDSEGYQELKKVTKDLTMKDRVAGQKLGVFGKAASMFVDVREGAYARRKRTQTDYAKAYETELAGRVGAAGAKIVSAFGRKNNTGAAGGNGTVPPPLPTSSYYVAMYGKTAGPYDIPTLKQMSANGSVKVDTLVWKDGMDSWVEAGSVDELKMLFADGGTTPPPPPIPHE